MTTPDINPPTKPGSTLDAKTVQAGSTDKTKAGPALITQPPPPLPPSPAAGGPPPGGDYSLPVLIGVFVLALVGIGLLGLGIYTVMKFGSNTAVAVGASTSTRVPLPTQAVLVPTTTPAPTATNTATKAPTATAVPATATSAATTAPITSTAGITPTQAGNLLTVVQGANVRGGPGTNYPLVGNIRAGDTAPVVGRDAAGTWFVISFRGGFGGQGWISAASSITSFDGDKSKLPVMAAPPPPAATATPRPGGNPNGGLVNGSHGVSGNLNLCSNKVIFAVNERVCFVEWIKNNTTQAIAYGILGVTAVRDGGGTQFQTSWSGEQAAHGLLGIDAGCIGPTDRCKGQWEDGMRLGSAGSYRLFLNVCFSDFNACRGSSGDWEVLSGAIVITVQ